MYERIDSKIKATNLERVECFLSQIMNRVPADKSIRCFDTNGVDNDICVILLKRAQGLPLEEQMRVYSYASCAATVEMREILLKKSFYCVREAIKAATIVDNFHNICPTIKKESCELSLPLRVNWCGTWTDAPPYCLENGGAVINAAIKINGVLPVKVLIQKLDEPKVILEHFDSDCRGEFHKSEELSGFSKPHEPFSLLKSALAVCGIIPIPGHETKENMFEKLGGGIFLSTGVVGIPKGSGLGTSSILLAGCIKSIFDFIGQKITSTEICSRVLLAEQLMETGGGWQDQAGGLTNGIKLVSSEPGFKQEVKCETLKVPQKFMDELNDRFCLIYSGQRRLGRTILREIMGGYIQSDPIFIDALEEMFALSGDMKSNIESGNMEGFIENLNRQMQITKNLNTGYTNESIDQILDACADMTAGRMMCGAGGGGFIQIVLKEGFSKKDLSSRLNASFPKQGIDVWDCDFV